MSQRHSYFSKKSFYLVRSSLCNKKIIHSFTFTQPRKSQDKSTTKTGNMINYSDTSKMRRSIGEPYFDKQRILRLVHNNLEEILAGRCPAVHNLQADKYSKLPDNADVLSNFIGLLAEQWMDICQANNSLTGFHHNVSNSGAGAGAGAGSGSLKGVDPGRSKNADAIVQYTKDAYCKLIFDEIDLIIDEILVFKVAKVGGEGKGRGMGKGRDKNTEKKEKKERMKQSRHQKPKHSIGNNHTPTEKRESLGGKKFKARREKRDREIPSDQNSFEMTTARHQHQNQAMNANVELQGTSLQLKNSLRQVLKENARLEKLRAALATSTPSKKPKSASSRRKTNNSKSADILWNTSIIGEAQSTTLEHIFQDGSRSPSARKKRRTNNLIVRAHVQQSSRNTTMATSIPTTATTKVTTKVTAANSILNDMRPDVKGMRKKLDHLCVDKKTAKNLPSHGTDKSRSVSKNEIRNSQFLENIEKKKNANTNITLSNQQDAERTMQPPNRGKGVKSTSTRSMKEQKNGMENNNTTKIPSPATRKSTSRENRKKVATLAIKQHAGISVLKKTVQEAKSATPIVNKFQTTTAPGTLSMVKSVKKKNTTSTSGDKTFPPMKSAPSNGNKSMTKSASAFMAKSAERRNAGTSAAEKIVPQAKTPPIGSKSIGAAATPKIATSRKKKNAEISANEKSQSKRVDSNSTPNHDIKVTGTRRVVALRSENMRVNTKSINDPIPTQKDVQKKDASSEKVTEKAKRPPHNPSLLRHNDGHTSVSSNHSPMEKGSADKPDSSTHNIATPEQMNTEKTDLSKRARKDIDVTLASAKNNIAPEHKDGSKRILSRNTSEFAEKHASGVTEPSAKNVFLPEQKDPLGSIHLNMKKLEKVTGKQACAKILESTVNKAEPSKLRYIRKRVLAPSHGRLLELSESLRKDNHTRADKIKPNERNTSKDKRDETNGETQSSVSMDVHNTDRLKTNEKDQDEVSSAKTAEIRQSLRPANILKSNCNLGESTILIPIQTVANHSEMKINATTKPVRPAKNKGSKSTHKDVKNFKANIDSAISCPCPIESNCIDKYLENKRARSKSPIEVSTRSVKSTRTRPSTRDRKGSTSKNKIAASPLNANNEIIIPVENKRSESSNSNFCEDTNLRSHRRKGNDNLDSKSVEKDNSQAKGNPIMQFNREDTRKARLGLQERAILEDKKTGGSSPIDRSSNDSNTKTHGKKSSGGISNKSIDSHEHDPQNKDEDLGSKESKGEHLLESIPQKVREDFKQQGFTMWVGRYQPILQLGPYDMAALRVRKEWFGMFEEVSRNTNM